MCSLCHFYFWVLPNQFFWVWGWVSEEINTQSTNSLISRQSRILLVWTKERRTEMRKRRAYASIKWNSLCWKCFLRCIILAVLWSSLFILLASKTKAGHWLLTLLQLKKQHWYLILILQSHNIHHLSFSVYTRWKHWWLLIVPLRLPAIYFSQHLVPC